MIVSNLTGTYYPSAPGARTIAEARDLMHDGKRVSVVVEGLQATLFVGGRAAWVVDLPDNFTPADVNEWAQQMIAEGYGDEREIPVPIHLCACGVEVDSEGETCLACVDEDTPSDECPNCGGTISVNGDRYTSESPRALICEGCELVYG